MNMSIVPWMRVIAIINRWGGRGELLDASVFWWERWRVGGPGNLRTYEDISRARSSVLSSMSRQVRAGEWVSE